MSELLTKAKQQIIVWKLAILIGFLFTINALCCSVFTAFAGGAKWSTMDTQSKILLCVAVFQSWTGVMLAFLNKTASKISQGELPFNGDTQQFRNLDFPAGKEMMQTGQFARDKDASGEVSSRTSDSPTAEARAIISPEQKQN